jgi:SAM-dependent methyltransferase
MPSTFNANRADAYERMMGRWSRRLAPLVIGFAGIADGEQILDVGCGTGSLTFALPRAANVASVTGIDFAQPYVEYTRGENTDPRITIQQGDACAMPFNAGEFDRAIAMLSLQFIPEVEHAVAEMRRVVQPGGIVAAAVWDTFGGMPSNRMFWDIAGVLDPEAIAQRARMYFNPITQPGGLGALWRRCGLRDVSETMLLVRMDFANFDDYWEPIASGEGSLGQYHAGLSDAARAALRESVGAAYLGGAADGARSFAAVALACRGVVPRPG